MKRYISLVELAKRYEISYISAYGWVRRGYIKSKKENGKIFIEDSKLVHSLARKAQKRREAALLGLERKKNRKESDKYVNAKGEITDFWKWMKADSPLAYIIDVNK